MLGKMTCLLHQHVMMCRGSAQHPATYRDRFPSSPQAPASRRGEVGFPALFLLERGSFLSLSPAYSAALGILMAGDAHTRHPGWASLRLGADGRDMGT